MAGSTRTTRAPAPRDDATKYGHRPRCAPVQHRARCAWTWPSFGVPAPSLRPLLPSPLPSFFAPPPLALWLPPPPPSPHRCPLPARLGNLELAHKCTVCRMTLTGILSWEQHVTGERDLRTLAAAAHTAPADSPEVRWSCPSCGIHIDAP